VGCPFNLGLLFSDNDGNLRCVGWFVRLVTICVNEGCNTTENFTIPVG